MNNAVDKYLRWAGCQSLLTSTESAGPQNPGIRWCTLAYKTAAVRRWLLQVGPLGIAYSDNCNQVL